MHREVEISRTLHDIRFKPAVRRDVFLRLHTDEQAVVLRSISTAVLEQLLIHLHHRDIEKVMEHMDPDAISQVLRHVSRRKRTLILKHVSKQVQDTVECLLGFDANSAASLMSVDYVLFEAKDSVTHIVRHLKKHEKTLGSVPTLLVVRKGILVGEIHMYQLVVAPKQAVAGDLVGPIMTISYDKSSKEALALFRSHAHAKVVVLGETGGVLGVIYADNVLRVLGQHKAASLYDFAGVHPEESVVDVPAVKVKFRASWLIVNLFTAFLAAATVGLFDEVIAAYVLLAAYMPIVAGMGGNAATQTLAVMVRGLSLHQVDGRIVWQVMRRELEAALFNGIINGLIVATVVLILHKDVKLALVLAIAMVINLLVAAFFGTLVPFIVKKMGKDPATSATIFITTATDVLGFMVFLGLASWVLL